MHIVIDWITDPYGTLNRYVDADWKQIERLMSAGDLKRAQEKIERQIGGKFGEKFIVGSYNDEYILISAGGDLSYHYRIAQNYLRDHDGDLRVFGGGEISINHLCGIIRFHGSSGDFGPFDHLLVRQAVKPLEKELEGTWLAGYRIVVDPPSVACYTEKK